MNAEDDPTVGTGLRLVAGIWTHAAGDEHAQRILSGEIPLAVARAAERRAQHAHAAIRQAAGLPSEVPTHTPRPAPPRSPAPAGPRTRDPPPTSRKW